WWAKSRPVRPNPVTTSSSTRSAPVSSHRRRRAGRNPGEGMRTPASACTGSTITAAVVSSMAASAAGSSKGSHPTAGRGGAEGNGVGGCAADGRRTGVVAGKPAPEGENPGPPRGLAGRLEGPLDRLCAAGGEVDDVERRAEEAGQARREPHLRLLHELAV